MKAFFPLLIPLLIIVGCGTRNTKQVVVESPYGDWEICDYMNDFDEPTGQKYVRQIVLGDFSNSATASRPLLVYLYINRQFRDYSGRTRFEGKILFDEYRDGTADAHMWSDGSPAKRGTKIVDKLNHKSYHYEEKRAFRDIDDGQWYEWTNILFDTPSTYTFTVKGDYKDEFRFTINSDKLELALKDAGILNNTEEE